jgi:acetyl-CoA synthetase
VGKGRTGVVTVSTGEGSLIADLAPQLGLDLPPIPPEAAATIARALPTLTHVENPLDPWGAGEGAPTYRACFEAFARSGGYDVVALVHDFPYRSQPGEVALAVELGAELIAATSTASQVLPVFVSLTSGDVTAEVEAQMDAAGGVPILRGTRHAFGAIAKLAWWERRRAARLERGPVRAAWPDLAAETPRYAHASPHPASARAASAASPASAATARSLPERESLELLHAAGLTTVEMLSIPIAEAVKPDGGWLGEGATGGARLKWLDFFGRVVVKVDAPGLAHKSDRGGVVVGVSGPEAVETAIARVLAAAPDARGVLIQNHVSPGVELILGARRDPQLGPLVLVGLGGILAEVLADVAIRLAPVSEDDGLEMLAELRGSRILDGPRNLPIVNRRPVVAAIQALGAAMLANPTWLEVDCNPVIAGPERAVAVDALIVTADVEHPAWDYEDPGGRLQS